MTHVLMLGAALPLLDRLNNYISYFPLFAFIALLLAGLNLPFSEDLLIVSGALICQADHSVLPLTLAMLYAGVLLSDMVSYYLGRLASQGALKLNYVQAALKHRYVGKLKIHLDRHGTLTFIVCRFIPFGVRNALFMSSGFFGLSFRQFASYDLIASLISVNVLFWLVYVFGEGAEKPLHVAGIIMFIALTCLALSVITHAVTKLIRRKNK